MSKNELRSAWEKVRVLAEEAYEKDRNSIEYVVLDGLERSLHKQLLKL